MENEYIYKTKNNIFAKTKINCITLYSMASIELISIHRQIFLSHQLQKEFK